MQRQWTNIVKLICVLVTCNLVSYAEVRDSINISNIDSLVETINTRGINEPNELAWRLTENIKNDSLKVRAIYYWITKNIAYDMKSYVTEFKLKRLKGEDNDAYNYRRICRTLRMRKGICDDYAMLFQYLCNENKINCKKIVGWGLTTSPNIIVKTLLIESDANHAWNSVMLNGKWYLMDLTWASGNVVSYKGKRSERPRNDYYYLTKPDDFILDHHPVDARWQLLKKPLRIKKFIANAKKNRKYYLEVSRGKTSNQSLIAKK